jgi:hypothetical protein
MRLRHSIGCLCVVFAISACRSDETTVEMDVSDDIAADVSSDNVDLAKDTAEPDPMDVSIPETPRCEEGFEAYPLEPSADFELMTLSGPFRLSETWSGCATHVFLISFPTVPGLDRSFFKTSPELLFSDGHEHAHYHFVSDAETEDARIDALLDIAARIDAAANIYLKEESRRTEVLSRIHYVVDRARDLSHLPGDFIREELAYAADPAHGVDLGERGVLYPPPPFFFALGPDLKIEDGDSLAPLVGSPQTVGMAAYLPAFIGWRHGLEARLGQEDAVVVPLIDEETTARILEREVDLPNGDFDTLQFDVEVRCDARNPFACSEWDRIANISLCMTDDCATRHELVRWITPYWRRGLQRYLLDASPLLPLFPTGTARLRVELGPEWERPTPQGVKVSLRLSDSPDRFAPSGVIPVATSDAFDAEYGKSVTSEFDIPEGVTRVELIALISGHGQTENDNCAEWCDHRHVFSIDGKALPPILHEGPPLGDMRGCATLSKSGVLPGQWGNWAPQRAFWCPGLPVSWHIRDITALATAGRHELSLSGTLGERILPRGGEIALSAYIIWYR